MKLQLKKPLIIFDLETTGLDITKAKIIQISFIKVHPDGREERHDSFINPEEPIPDEVKALTHITDEDVASAPTFKRLGPRIAEVFAGCDLCGYNSNNFDVPMLAEEFLRHGIEFDFSKCLLIDASVIFKKMEQRNLAAAYKFYTGRKMEEDLQAHRSDQDAEATYRVLLGELEMYSPERQEEEDRILKNDMSYLAEFSQMNRNVDFAGRIIYNDKNVEVFNFGKYKGQPVRETMIKDPGYFNWIQQGDFPLNTKQVLTRIRLRELNNAR